MLSDTVDVSNLITEVVQIRGAETQQNITQVNQRGDGVQGDVPILIPEDWLHMVEGQHKGNKEARINGDQDDEDVPVALPVRIVRDCQRLSLASWLFAAVVLVEELFQGHELFLVLLGLLRIELLPGVVVL